MWEELWEAEGLNELILMLRAESIDKQWGCKHATYTEKVATEESKPEATRFSTLAQDWDEEVKPTVNSQHVQMFAAPEL